MQSDRVETIPHKDTSSACLTPDICDVPFLPAQKDRAQMPDVGQYCANVIGCLGKGVAMNKLRTLADLSRRVREYRRRQR